MFNQSSFNRTPFNRPFTIFVLGTITLNGIGGMTAKGNVEASPSIQMGGVGTMDARFIRELMFAAKMDGVGEMTASYIRERYSSATLHGVGEMTANAGRFHVDYIEFTGNFAPGDRIVIDAKKLKMTMNGANALHLMQGNFFDLNLGTNEIIYTDPETSRNVLIRFTHRDKFV